MMKLTLELVALVISIGTFVWGIIAWYSGAVQKKYASQRDFEHLKKNYQNLSEGQSVILKDIDAKFDFSNARLDQLMLELKELKGLQTAILVKVAPQQTGGWSKRDI